MLLDSLCFGRLFPMPVVALQAPRQAALCSIRYRRPNNEFAVIHVRNIEASTFSSNGDTADSGVGIGGNMKRLSFRMILSTAVLSIMHMAAMAPPAAPMPAPAADKTSLASRKSLSFSTASYAGSSQSTIFTDH
ncbi:MAG: hypothetical protein ABSH33_22550 [Steroidobacteraceae bacterium]|jgi:hypothetical protein